MDQVAGGSLPLTECIFVISTFNLYRALPTEISQDQFSSTSSLLPWEMMLGSMFQIPLLLVGLWLMSSGVSGIVTLDFEVDVTDENLIFLECFGDGDTEPNQGAVFVFTNPLTGTSQTRTLPSDENRLRYEVTPENEAEIRCALQDVPPSQAISIAGECSEQRQ